MNIPGTLYRRTTHTAYSSFTALRIFRLRRHASRTTFPRGAHHLELLRMLLIRFSALVWGFERLKSMKQMKSTASVTRRTPL